MVSVVMEINGNDKQFLTEHQHPCLLSDLKRNLNTLYFCMSTCYHGYCCRFCLAVNMRANQSFVWLCCTVCVVFSVGVVAVRSTQSSYPDYKPLSDQLIDYINHQANSTWKVQNTRLVTQVQVKNRKIWVPKIQITYTTGLQHLFSQNYAFSCI